jgi:hypothetical protein
LVEIPQNEVHWCQFRYRTIRKKEYFFKKKRGFIMKKTLVLGAMVMSLAFVFTGCGSADNGSDAEIVTEAPVEEQTEAVEETTEEITVDEAAEETTLDEAAAEETTADEAAAEETTADEAAAEETTVA